MRAKDDQTSSEHPPSNRYHVTTPDFDLTTWEMNPHSRTHDLSKHTTHPKWCTHTHSSHAINVLSMNREMIYQGAKLFHVHCLILQITIYAIWSGEAGSHYIRTRKQAFKVVLDCQSCSWSYLMLFNCWTRDHKFVCNYKSAKRNMYGGLMPSHPDSLSESMQGMYRIQTRMIQYKGKCLQWDKWYKGLILIEFW